ncbi:YidH family protein [Pseudorhodoferax soli]|nr:DUF202 domain-containing protein [Pseudorhodoferax soli]
MLSKEPGWRLEGEDPDYRFVLANERTFLAWIRTALAVLAAGVLLDQFSSKLQPHLLVVLLAITLCVLAGTLCAVAYRRWQVNEVAMRHRLPLPSSPALALLAAALAASGLGLSALILIGVRW